MLTNINPDLLDVRTAAGSCAALLVTAQLEVEGGHLNLPDCGEAAVDLLQAEGRGPVVCVAAVAAIAQRRLAGGDEVLRHIHLFRLQISCDRPAQCAG